MLKIVCQRWKESMIQRFLDAEQLRIENKFCDITLKSVDKVSIRAHKIILIIGSGYFKDLFSTEMKESSEDCIEYNLIKGDILEKVINFIYTGELEAETAEQIEQIAICANYFQLEKLIDECMKLLNEFLDDNNCLKYWRLAHECFHKEFEEKCISHMFKSPDRTYKNDIFFNDLDKDEIEILFSDDRLQWLENEKFEKILQWTKHNTNTKEEFQTIFSNLLKFVNFTSISRNVILPIILNDERLTEHKDLLSTIGTKCIKEPKRRLLALIGDELKIISNDGDITTLQRKENSLRHIADTTFKNFLFICGGRDKNFCASNICEYFDPLTKEWITLEPMPTLRFHHSCACLEDKIYVCGGYNGTKLSNVEIFDINQEKWMISEKCLNFARYYFGLVAANRCLYAVGGYGATNIEMFDPRAPDRWTKVYAWYTGFNYIQCVSIDNQIYCFHSSDYKDPTIFDTKMNRMRTWFEIKNFKSIKQWPFKICILNNNFNLIQKNSDNWNYADFFRYDFDGNLTCSKAKTAYLNSCSIESLVALNF